MDKRKQPDQKHENPLPGEISSSERDLNRKARHEADKDIEEDAELSARSPNDDLDEGESARLGEDGSVI